MWNIQKRCDIYKNYFGIINFITLVNKQRRNVIENVWRGKVCPISSNFVPPDEVQESLFYK